MVGAILGAVGSGIGAIASYKAAGRGAEAGKKAARKQKQYAIAERKASEGQYATDIATQNRVLADQQAARQAAYSDQKNRLLAAQGDVSGALQPYMDYGQSALDAQRGQFGGPDAAGYIQRFQESPDWVLNHEAAIRAAQEGVDARYTAGGGLNSGAALKALQDRSIEETNKFVNQYADRIGQGIAVGQNAAGQYVDAQGRLVGLGMEAAGQWGAGGASDLSAYGEANRLLGNTRINNLYTSYGNQATAAASKAAAIAGGQTGQAQAINSGINNAFSAINNAGPWSGGASANPYGSASSYYPTSNRLLSPANDPVYPGKYGR